MFAVIALLSILAQTAIDDPNRFNGYLLLAYGVIWLVGLIYVALLANRQRNAKQDLQLMKRLLEEERDERGG